MRSGSNFRGEHLVTIVAIVSLVIGVVAIVALRDGDFRAHVTPQSINVEARASESTAKRDRPKLQVIRSGDELRNGGGASAK
jgi:hypothetical protein